MKKVQSGFTLVDLVVVLASVAVLFGLVSVNVLNVQNTATITSSFTTLISDLRSQQLKAMIGDTEGRSTADNYGIHFDETSYTLFHGATFNPSDQTNFTVELPETVRFANVTVPSNNVIFEVGSGEFVSYNADFDRLTLENPTNNDSRTVELNSLGVVNIVN